MFKGEKTAVFWLGLLVFGYSLVQFCSAIWQAIYYLLIFPRVYPFQTHSDYFIQAEAVYPLVPNIISGIIFAVIGLYIMKKGIKQEQPSTQN